ncbi:hypothetical protein DSO57_1028096 [Entomophthora muscae]|uniref:Uncharacterized protein n=1 Tax=Entomophthora muscae TaxID=34485 RepID=A0ACC2U060_9FUNG|nr:hypothetical protein DSO57_1028096 [Entomophthora muscae]
MKRLDMGLNFLALPGPGRLVTLRRGLRSTLPQKTITSFASYASLSKNIDYTGRVTRNNAVALRNKLQVAITVNTRAACFSVAAPVAHPKTKVKNVQEQFLDSENTEFVKDSNVSGWDSHEKETLGEAAIFGENQSRQPKRTATQKSKRKSEDTSYESPLKSIPLKRKEVKYQKLSAATFKFEALKGPKLKDIANIKFGLDRCLFNPGVTYLQDPHTSIYNFDPYLQKIVDVDQFDFSKIVGYIPAGRDETLIQIARKHKKQFVSTTSSTTQMLCHLYFIISHWRPFDATFLSASYQRFSTQYSKTLTFPPSVRLKKHKGGVYSINADKTFDNETTVLSQLGQVMERMLTMSPLEFSKYLIKPTLAKEESQPQDTPEPEISLYNYSLTKNMVLRAQLDCADKRLPRKIYDLKTRAALPIRLDQSNYKDYLSYDIKTLHGVHESFEREYFDLMRSAFLKYSFQVRIGQMDGCLVAYHNTETIYGFQYVSLPEMDRRMFGNSVMGDQVFANVTQLLENILTEITAKYTDDEIMLTFKTVQDSLLLQIYVEVINKEQPDSTEKDDEIYAVDPLNRLAKYQVVCFSTVNGEKRTKPISLNAIPDLDNWEVHYCLTEVSMDSLDLYNEYLTLRHTQASYYDYDREGMSVLQRFRNLTTFNKDNPSPPKSKPVVFKSSH